jgi:hypothetical protein
LSAWPTPIPVLAVLTHVVCTRGQGRTIGPSPDDSHNVDNILDYESNDISTGPNEFFDEDVNFDFAGGEFDYPDNSVVDTGLSFLDNVPT